MRQMLSLTVSFYDFMVPAGVVSASFSNSQGAPAQAGFSAYAPINDASGNDKTTATLIRAVNMLLLEFVFNILDETRDVFISIRLFPDCRKVILTIGFGDGDEL